MVVCIIPYHNYMAFVLEAVKSVYDQVDRIIIINDHSDTANRDYVKNEVCYTRDKIDYLENGGSQGMATARNEGLRAAFKWQPDYICFLDADDMRVPWSINRQVEYFKEHPETEVVWGNACEIRGDVKMVDVITQINKLRIHPAEVNPQTVLYRPSVFQKYGGFYEPLISGTDKEMCMRLGLHPESPFRGLVKCKKLKDIIALYRKHDGQIHKKRKADPVWHKEAKKMQKERLKIQAKEGITRENTRFPYGE